jgi:hypothetical protein
MLLDLGNVLSGLVLSSKLLIDSLSSASQVGLVVGSIFAPVNTSDEPRCMGEQVVHLLERKLFGLRNKGPNTEGIGEVADNKNQVVLPANRAYSDTSNLTNHGVESE